MIQNYRVSIYLKRLKSNPDKIKTVHFPPQYVPIVVEALQTAAFLPPNTKDRVFIGMIHCLYGTIEVEIGPYWWGSSSALFLRQNGRAVAIEHDYLIGVSQWMQDSTLNSIWMNC